MSMEFKLTVATVFVLLAPFGAGLFCGVADVMFGGSNQGVGRRPLQKFYDLLDLWKNPEPEDEKATLVRMKGALVFMAVSGVVLVVGQRISLCAMAFGAGVLLIQGSTAKQTESRMLLGIPILFSAAAGMVLLFGTDGMETAIASSQLLTHLPAIWLGILVMTGMISAELRKEMVAGESEAAHGYRMVILWYELCIWAGLLYAFLWEALSENSWAAGFLSLLLCLATELISRLLPRIPTVKSSAVARKGGLLLLAAIAFNLLVISFRMR